MKMIIASSVVAIVIAIVGYVVLTNTGMDSASVYSGTSVRLN